MSSASRSATLLDRLLLAEQLLELAGLDEDHLGAGLLGARLGGLAEVTQANMIFAPGSSR